MTRYAALVLALALTTACDDLRSSNNPAPPSTPGGVRVHRLQISQHPQITFPLTQAEVDRIMLDTANVISQTHRPGAASCPLRLEQAGPLRTLPRDAPSIVRSSNDFDRLDDPGLGGEDGSIRAVHVVLGINWCGRNGANIIGCANIPGRAIVVVRQPADTEGQLWGHEFGHNRGLDHVENPQRLMNPFLAATAKDLDVDECHAYRGPEPLLTAGERRFPSALQAAPAAAGGMDILAYVRQRSPHGSTELVIAASRFSPGDVDRAMALLADPGEKPFWANIVLVAGAAGRPETAGRLIAFLFDRDRDPTDIAAEQARQQVPIALGYLANRNENKTAMTFLMRHSQPGSWRTYANRARSIDAATGLERLMASQNIEGLVLSGQPAATAKLAEDQRALRDAGRPALPGSARGAGSADAVRESEMLIDALARIRRVQQEGLGGAYRRE